jgi:hypothetical protein
MGVPGKQANNGDCSLTLQPMKELTLQVILKDLQRKKHFIQHFLHSKTLLYTTQGHKEKLLKMTRIINVLTLQYRGRDSGALKKGLIMCFYNVFRGAIVEQDNSE